MTENEWLGCTDAPNFMLNFLSTKASERRLRLAACACCRRIWSLLTDARLRNAVEFAERFADELVSRETLTEVYQSAEQLMNDVSDNDRVIRQAGSAVVNAATKAKMTVRYPHQTFRTASAARQIALASHPDFNKVPHLTYDAIDDAETTAHCDILRDIFGNPFRPVTLKPSWKTPAVLTLATAAYENRILPAGTLEPARLAVLADALEEAGCDNGDVLRHLRQPAVHVRGCWAVDLLLGRE